MAATSNPLPELLTERDVARVTGLSVASVRRWRLLREGPRYLMLGAAVRYSPADIKTWLASRATGGAEVPPVASVTAGYVPSSTVATSRRGGARNGSRA